MFAFSINKKPPRAYSDFLDRVRNYITDEALTSKKSGAAKTSREKPEGDQQKENKRPAETPQKEASSFTMIRGIATHFRKTRRPELVNNGTVRTANLPPRSKRPSSTRKMRLTPDPIVNNGKGRNPPIRQLRGRDTLDRGTPMSWGADSAIDEELYPRGAIEAFQMCFSSKSLRSKL